MLADFEKGAEDQGRDEWHEWGEDYGEEVRDGREVGDGEDVGGEEGHEDDAGEQD